jgi:hypothetical protein
MEIVYRRDLDRPLTNTEMDNNIQHIVQAVQKLQEKIDALEHQTVMVVKKITIENNQFVMQTQDGQTLSTPMPALSFHFRQQWKPKENYGTGDWVQYENSLWCCKETHVSRDQWKEDAALWTLIWQSQDFPEIRGPWQPQKAYEKGDWVQHELGLYVCLDTHRSEEYWGSEKWQSVYELTITNPPQEESKEQLPQSSVEKRQ